MTHTESSYFATGQASQLLRTSFYTLAAVIGLAMAEPARAAVITKDFEISLGSETTEGYSFDINGDGKDDLSVLPMFGPSSASISIAGQWSNLTAASNFNLQLFEIGDSVSGLSTFEGIAFTNLSGPGTFYAGFSLNQETEINYGWLSFSLTELGENGKLIIHSAAYESAPNIAIQIIPEPSTGIFVSLAAIVGGLVSWRRSRSVHS